MKVFVPNTATIYLSDSSVTDMSYYQYLSGGVTFGKAAIAGGVRRRLVIEGASMSNVCEYYDE